MLNGKSKNNNGITLVGLVVTIILLLILATISIQSLTNTGLLKKANEAKQKTKNAEENQAKMLNEYEDELNKYISGTVKETFKGTTVADAIQYGDVLNKDDNTELHDAYGNKIVVPAGFKIISNSDTSNATTVDKGIVIEDVTSEATAGSQFVWIPVGKIYTDTTRTDANFKTINLNRYTFDENGNPTAQGENKIACNYNSSITMQELNLSSKENIVAKNITTFKTSITANGGYYVGRYEARTVTARTTANNVLTQITEKGTDQVYNFVTQPQAANQAQNMYNSNKFTSDLMNSYAWDTTILFLQYCGKNAEYSNQNSLNTNSIAQTGTTNDIQCNVYDMASNIREWSTETSDDPTGPCVYRGGSYSHNFCNTSYRDDNNISCSVNSVGFRPILYINI